MLKEFVNVRQHPGEPKRRWFQSEVRPHDFVRQLVIFPAADAVHQHQRIRDRDPQCKVAAATEPPGEPGDQVGDHNNRGEGDQSQ